MGQIVPSWHIVMSSYFLELDYFKTHTEAFIFLHRNEKPIHRKKGTESTMLRTRQLLFFSTDYEAGPRMNQENFIRKIAGNASIF